MTKIMFGTDGWRAIMGKEFTLSNVKVVSQAITDYIKDHDLHRFAHGVCRVMLAVMITLHITLQSGTVSNTF